MSLVGYSPYGCKELDITEQLNIYIVTYTLITQPKILHGSHFIQTQVHSLYGKSKLLGSGIVGIICVNIYTHTHTHTHTHIYIYRKRERERERERDWVGPFPFPLCFRPNGHKLKWICRFVSEPSQASSHPDPWLIHKDERQVWGGPGAGVDIINNYLDRNDSKHPSICLEVNNSPPRNLCLFSLFIKSLHYYSLWELGLRWKRNKVKSDSVWIYPRGVVKKSPSSSKCLMMSLVGQLQSKTTDVGFVQGREI